LVTNFETHLDANVKKRVSPSIGESRKSYANAFQPEASGRAAFIALPIAVHKESS
jgi:hypothetical protein